MLRRATVLATAALLGTPPAYAAEALSFRQIPFSLPIDAHSITTVDLNGDGRLDLLVQQDRQLRAYIQSADGFDFSSDFVDLAPRGGTSTLSLGWDLSRTLGEDSSRPALITLEAGREVYATQLSPDDQGWGEPKTLLSELRAPIGAGVHRLHFVRDVDADGHDDLLIPEADRIAILLSDTGSEGGGFQAPLRVETESRLSTTLYSPDLSRRIGQSLRIPALTLRDVNSDGSADLISDTDAALSVFLADAASPNYFPRGASYAIDREEIEARLGEFDIENLDFSNLTGVLALTHEELLEDIDGDGVEDLLLREGGKVSVFGGRADGLDLETPRQVLRSGGNVLTTFLHDEDGDGAKDLWLWRVEPISVGDIFVWLALSGSISVEAFVYRNQGDEFARRPARKISVALKFPSVIRLASSLRDIADEARASSASMSSLSIEAQLDGSGRGEDPARDDLLILANAQLQGFLGAIDVTPAAQFLGSLGYSSEKDDYEIDLKGVIDSALASAEPQDAVVSPPSFTLPVTADVKSGGLVAARINDDSKDDIFVFTAMTPDAIEGILLLSE